MLTAINDAILRLADVLLGWLLVVPTDVALILVAVGTGAILAVVRLFTTNQDLLRRASDDKKRLKTLIREAKRRKDKAAVGRFRASQNMIGLKTMKSEGWPLVAAILPILVVATWCFQRLAVVPPRAGEAVPLVAYFPVSAAGQVVHLVPQDGLSVEDGWVREIEPVTDPAEGPPHATATWLVKADSRPEPYLLEIRYKRGTYTKELLVGQRVSSPPVEFYADDDPLTSTELKLQPVKLFGLVPGIEWLCLPPWMAAYFLIAIPSVSLLKRLAGIY
jgi:uncharacterized membrane protein (DUF106 family)